MKNNKNLPKKESLIIPQKDSPPPSPTLPKKWYLSLWIIALCFALFSTGIMPIIGVILIILRKKDDKAIAEKATKFEADYNFLKASFENMSSINEADKNHIQSLSEENRIIAEKVSKFKTDYNTLEANYNSLKESFDLFGINDIIKAQNILNSINDNINENNNIINRLRSDINALVAQKEKLDKQRITETRKLTTIKWLYSSMSYSVDTFFALQPDITRLKLPENTLDSIETYSPTIFLKLHCMDVKDLRKAYKENDKQISKILEQYSSRYTTKANQTIYQLMVLALRAELQNILYNLKYEKLDTAIDSVKNMTAKYLAIAGEGNQSIVGTLTKFIGEIEYFFINAVKIEYNYYVKKEQAKQEQMAIREQMRQEAEERKALEAQKKKVEQEENKFKNEISKLEENLISSTASDDEIQKLQARILELQGQLSNVVLKKEEISNLQNGKAGNVYIISNLGSFGNDVFKIGMTRRLDPQERINELGSASVPFKFDVHSFIFSEDAVALESKLHNILNDKRVNKVNLRKEFFKVSIDELERLVAEIEPTAEFNRTMLAEEFNQSLSSSEVYSSDYVSDADADENEE